ncbi:MAG: hypothetical protein KTR25_06785 [Myxococcales bacterium]|nr:hypothetical protein [Myxococcales bacterium]
MYPATQEYHLCRKVALHLFESLEKDLPLSIGLIAMMPAENPNSSQNLHTLTYSQLQSAVLASVERSARIVLPKAVPNTEILRHFGLKQWNPLLGIASGEWAGKAWCIEFGIDDLEVC